MTRSYIECQPCNRQFSSDEALQSHLQHSSRHFWCDPCNRVFNSEDALESHLSTSKAHWCYICDPCNEVFDSGEALENHLLTFHADTYCYPCNRGFISADALQSHMRNAVVHRYELANLQEHNYAMHSVRDIKCWGCPKTFYNYSTLLAHLETETCITTRVGLDKLAMECEQWKDFVIPGCDAHLRGGMRARYVPEIVYKDHLLRFGCSSCEWFFPTDDGLMTHIRSSVHHPLVYQCTGCASQHVDLSSLLAHVEVGGCPEGVTYGTGSIGKLLRHLWQNLKE